MKKTTFVLIALLLGLALLGTGCKMPASQDPAPTLSPASEDTRAGSADTPAAPAAVDTTGGGKGAPTATAIPPMPTPLVVTSTAAPATAAPVPPTAVPTAVPPTATLSAPVGAGSRIQFAAGASAAAVDGQLDANQALFYLVSGASGQSMSVVVWSPNGDVSLGISGANTGQVLLDSALGETTWTGTLPATQDYYLTLVASGGRTSYSVSVELSQMTGGDAATPVPPPPGIFDPIAAYGLPNMSDPMNGGNLGDWANARGELPNTDNIRLEVDDARFYVTGKWVGFSTWWFSWRELTDFYLEMTVDTGACTGRDAYGFIVRGPEHLAGVSYGYVVAFSCDGHYWIYRLDGANPFTSVDLAAWTASEYILTGSNQHNVIGVQAVGDTLTIYANGHELTSVTDDRYDFGRYGLFVRPDVTLNYTYRVIRLSYWDLSD